MSRLTTAALAVLLCSACDDGSAKAKPEDAATPAEADAAEPAEVTDAPASEEPASSEPLSAAEADPLGRRFADPPWFRETMFGSAGKKVDFARSEANEAGLFKSHVIFELEEGTTKDQCVTMVVEKLAPTLELEQEDNGQGRVTLTGSTERYDVTAMCGEAKGKMRAYVGYEWTR